MKKYSVELDGKNIGYTFLEKHDAPMGVVMGKIFFEEIESPYEFFSSYCKKENIPINDNDSEHKFISTQTFNQKIEHLKVYNPERIEIKGVGVCITGFEDDLEIDIFGIPYPFYGEEFPDHRLDYENQFIQIKNEG